MGAVAGSMGAPKGSNAAARGDAARAPFGWRCGFENLAHEHAFVPLRVEGTLPPELRGTFYRNGPGRFDVAGERYRHWFDGDGAVTAVRLDGRGGALGASRLVATPWRERERIAGKRLYGAYGTPMARPIREMFFGDNKNQANTSVMVHDERLYALCEGGKPFEISTEDLSTLGESDFEGAITHAFSAHPHRAPSRRATFGFGLGVGKNTSITCYALKDGAKAERISSFLIRGSRMNHDFAVTDRHLVFFFAPLYISVWNALLRRPLVSSAKWRAEEGTEIAIVPIDDPSRVVRFTVPAFYMEHVVNAFELPGGAIAIDYIHYDHIRDFEDYVGGLVSGTPKGPLRSSIRRAVVNPKAKTLHHEASLDEAVELPRVSPKLETSRHRFVYAVAFDRTDAPPGAILKHDVETGRVQRYVPGVDHYPSESVFVPREGGTDEDDGWLLMLVLDAGSNTSRLEVLDAARLDAGPIARCHFEQAIPFGFHGLWDPAR
jgi:all-trans-8'-apo-beta-carotenal 15,15'-oxygenase